MRAGTLLTTLCTVGLALGVARSQDLPRVDLANVKEETRFGAATICEGSKGSQTFDTSGRLLALSLSIPDKQTYKIGEKVTFDVTLRNSGIDSVLVPTEACSKSSAVADRPGVIEACINLLFTDSKGRSDWFTGPCLCGGPDESSVTLKKLKAGDSIVISGKAEAVLSDPESFNDVYNGERPTLILMPDIDFFRQHFPTAEGSKPVDGCVEKMEVQIAAESKVSVQIAAAPRAKK
jgi:hypothetical protein